MKSVPLRRRRADPGPARAHRLRHARGRGGEVRAPLGVAAHGARGHGLRRHAARGGALREVPGPPRPRGERALRGRGAGAHRVRRGSGRSGLTDYKFESNAKI